MPPRWVFAITAVAALVVFLIALGPQLYYASQPTSTNHRATIFLRALGSSQLAYRDSMGTGRYGTFQELVEVDLIERGYTRSNMIDGYSIAVFLPDGRLSARTRSGRFAIVAIPKRSYRNRHLRTFAITDDQRVRQAPEGAKVVADEWLDEYNEWPPLR